MHDSYSAIKALNWSTLSPMAVSPLLARHRSQTPREDTPSLRLGRAIHAAILEPEEYSLRYVAKPEGLNLNTKEGRAWALEARERKVEVLTAAEAETCAACAAAVLSHHRACELLSGTERERTIEWSVDGVACKGRLDAVKGLALVDLKTIRDLSRIDRDAAAYHYFGQLAWYRYGAEAAGVLLDVADVYIIAVETVPPFDCGVLRVPQPVLAEGDRLWRRLLGEWLECERTGRWPGQIPTERDLTLPRWAWEDSEEEW